MGGRRKVESGASEKATVVNGLINGVLNGCCDHEEETATASVHCSSKAAPLSSPSADEEERSLGEADQAECSWQSQRAEEVSADSVVGGRDSVMGQTLWVSVDAAVERAAAALAELELSAGIRISQYQDERQIGAIMRLISRDLSEPYSVYTYRYFIHNWPHLCFLAHTEARVIFAVMPGRRRRKEGFSEEGGKAVEEQELVGAIVCKLDSTPRNTRRGYIAMLAVDQNYRRRHIGSRLVRRAIVGMRAGGCDEVVLETEVTNTSSLRLYEKLGFVRDKRLFRYYLNGVDAFRLKLWLTPPVLPFQIPFYAQ